MNDHERGRDADATTVRSWYEVASLPTITADEEAARPTTYRLPHARGKEAITGLDRAIR